MHNTKVESQILTSFWRSNLVSLLLRLRFLLISKRRLCDAPYSDTSVSRRRTSESSASCHETRSIDGFSALLFKLFTEPGIQ